MLSTRVKEALPVLIRTPQSLPRQNVTEFDAWNTVYITFTLQLYRVIQLVISNT